MSEIDYGLPFRESVDYPLPLNEALRELIASLRRQVLSEFIQNLMIALEAEGYHLDQLIDALADYADTKPEWGEGCGRLEEAAKAFLDVRKPLRQQPSEEKTAT